MSVIYVDFRKREPVHHWNGSGFVTRMERVRLRDQTWHHACKVHGLIGMRKGAICQACGMHENSTTFGGGAG